MSETMASLIESAMFVVFLSVFLEPKSHKMGFCFGAAITSLLLFLNIMVSDYFGFFNVYAMMVDMIITMIFWRFFLQNSILSYIMGFGLFYFGIYSSAYFAVFCFSFFHADLIMPAVSIGSSYRLWLLLVSKIFLFIYAIMILYNRKKFRYQGNGIFILCCALCPVVILGVFFVLTKILLELYFLIPEWEARVIGVIVGLHLMVVITVTLSLYAVKKQEKERETENLNYVMNLQKESLERFILQENETYKLKHELERKLFAIQYLFRENRSEEGIRVLQQMIIDLCGNAKEITVCQNIVDTVITNIEHKYKSNYFEMKKEILFHDEGIMEIGDLCILLGNMVDNAIEAAIESLEKQIRASVKEEYGCLHINVSNTYSKEKSDVKNFISYKRDCRKHGFGMRSIKGIVRQYRGELQMYDEGGWFYINVVIYGQK